MPTAGLNLLLSVQNNAYFDAALGGILYTLLLHTMQQYPDLNDENRFILDPIDPAYHNGFETLFRTHVHSLGRIELALITSSADKMAAWLNAKVEAFMDALERAEQTLIAGTLRLHGAMVGRGEIDMFLIGISANREEFNEQRAGIDAAREGSAAHAERPVQPEGEADVDGSGG
jgi:hypothetical protein